MFIGIDIGGTHIRVASGRQGKIERRLDFPTAELQTSIQDVKEAVRSLSHEAPIEKIGIGVPGPLETKTGRVLSPPHLTGWDNVEIADIFSKLLNLPVVVGHDASVAALAEFYYGAGRSSNPLLYYTVSTGIGVGLIVDGKIYRGLYNPEAGHQILGREGRLCLCKQEADLETYSSGEGLQILTGQDPVELEKTKLWQEALEWLAIGIANSILHYSPEIVVIGGGMTRHKNLFFPPLEKFIKRYLHELPYVPIAPATLGQDAGVIGALTLAERGG